MSREEGRVLGRIAMDPWRQMDILDPGKFPHPVHVFGVGATGSYFAETVAKMGIQRMAIYDFDVVDNHNVPNQVFGISDHKKPKVEALATRLRDLAGLEVTAINNKVKGVKGLSGIVFLGVDTMDSRKKIWQSSIRGNPAIEMVIETRMGAEFGKVFAFRPANVKHIEQWEATLFDDKDSDEPVCTNRAINSTIKTLAGIAAHSLVDLYQNNPYPNEVFLSMRPLTLYTKEWPS